MKEHPALRLWRGHTIHQRSIPFAHRFKYGLALIDVDIDRLEEAGRQSSVFSVDRSNLFSFNRRDHGNGENVDLRPWAEQEFTKAGIDLNGGPIRLVTFPRHAFYKFAPISLWLGHDGDGALKGILYEVNNTFGETHVYAAATPEGTRHEHATDKVFHVSPFFDVSGAYKFTLRWSETDLRLIVATQKRRRSISYGDHHSEVAHRDICSVCVSGSQQTAFKPHSYARHSLAGPKALAEGG